jgi:dolichol-phosphate mannosyltransferase
VTWQRTVNELHPRVAKYAVLIPILNEGQTILRQLGRMRDANCPADILLSDGGSQDGSTETSRLAELGVGCLSITNEPGCEVAYQRLEREDLLAEGQRILG